MATAGWKPEDPKPGAAPEGSPWYLKVWFGIKKWAYKWVGGLVLEPKKDGELVISLGRTSFLLVLGYLFNFWSKWGATQTVSLEELTKAIEAVGKLQGSPTAIAEAILAAVPVPDLAVLPPGLMQVFLICAGWVGLTKATEVVKKKYGG